MNRPMIITSIKVGLEGDVRLWEHVCNASGQVNDAIPALTYDPYDVYI